MRFRKTCRITRPAHKIYPHQASGSKPVSFRITDISIGQAQFRDGPTADLVHENKLVVEVELAICVEPAQVVGHRKYSEKRLSGNLRAQFEDLVSDCFEIT
jgi:hypothetical protein